MYHNAQHTTACLLLFLPLACLQPVEIITERLGGQVIISGQVSTLADQSIVRVDETAETERLPFPISGATVSLIEDDVFFAPYMEDSTNAGRYMLKDGHPLVGKTYYIDVVLPDGRKYQSVPEKMPFDPGSLSTYYEFVLEKVIDGPRSHSDCYLVGCHLRPRS